MKHIATVNVVKDVKGRMPAIHKFNPKVVPTPAVSEGLVSEKVGGFYAYFSDLSIVDQIAHILNVADKVTPEMTEEGEATHYHMDLDDDNLKDFVKSFRNNEMDVLFYEGKEIGYVMRDNEATTRLLEVLNIRGSDTQVVIACECDNTHRASKTVCRYCWPFLTSALAGLKGNDAYSFKLRSGDFCFQKMLVVEADVDVGNHLYVGNDKGFDKTYPLTTEGLAAALWETNQDAANLKVQPNLGSVKNEEGFNEFLNDATMKVRNLWEERGGDTISEHEALSLQDVLTQWFNDKWG